MNYFRKVGKVFKNQTIKEFTEFNRLLTINLPTIPTGSSQLSNTY